MRIAQIMAGAPQGGAELFFERMTIALANAGQDVLPIIRHDPGRLLRLRLAGLNPVEMRFGGPLDVFTTPKLRNVANAFGTEIAIAWMSRAAAHLPEAAWTNIGRLGGYYDLKYFRACHYLVGNTKGIVDYIVKSGMSASRAAYLPNFVTDFAGAEAASRQELGVPEGANLMLGLGRLHAVKGFDLLIKAASLLPDDVYCVIAGEGPERGKLEALIAELGVKHRVKLLGWRHDTGALLKTADIFVSSSRHEPLGNMVLEAFSAQTPVLAAQAEGPTEVIRHGRDGVLVPVEDARMLAAGAKAMFADVTLRVRLALNARQRFESCFSQAVVTKTWLDFLSGIKI
jgi:glycosyltransferase involved in cell wall biosynthesis